jgi:ATP-dependent protease Clp ATPase subunit
MPRNLVCSFCQKTEHQVAKLVAGPNVFICDECVAIAALLMHDADATPQAPRASGWQRVRDLFGRVRRYFVVAMPPSTGSTAPVT